jgi:hypothetical protein
MAACAHAEARGSGERVNSLGSHITIGGGPGTSSFGVRVLPDNPIIITFYALRARAPITQYPAP